ncbi:hypothetical protein NEUTE1DRAFT_100197 [Neurospora tetrasperma FGSC 2508]|uniref:Uncharacterized protein n=1 Tax=Neurospora tetrasperma (strain FGSC 2508 / ATCC MYA-4615 / P0657) TaxID=510951 RepID=F8MN59_NEUT8|nr:uncharacterized protein NEUTE1DRAFT_100197 [Neurospora tetrasperma FGSC 2508]EGO57232.1 hypothetical protein NEUTE1DRAFT_100197 [Neurospora tetrasperma FGSC 2508]
MPMPCAAMPCWCRWLPLGSGSDCMYQTWSIGNGCEKTGQSERGLSNAAQGSIEADGQELLQQKESEAEASDTLFLTMGRKSRRSSVVSVIHVLCY